jgi:Ca2+/H+ antiporter, TMEM165/GDT1 family
MHLFPFIAAFLIVGLAELGDKTQFLTIALASKYPMEKVLYGVVAASGISMLLAVLIGGFVHRLIPGLLISVLAGGFFIIYGLTMILPIKPIEQPSETKAIVSKDPFMIVFSSLFIAELGDKTQLATLALAAKYSSLLLVWAGATLGMIVVNLFGIVIGNFIANYLPEKTANFLAGCIFILFGAITFLGILLKV